MPDWSPDTAETLASLDLRIADRLVAGHDISSAAHFINRPITFVESRIAQPGFHDLLAARREEFTNHTRNLLQQQAHQASLGACEGIISLRRIINNGTTDAAKIGVAAEVAFDLEGGLASQLTMVRRDHLFAIPNFRLPLNQLRKGLYTP